MQIYSALHHTTHVCYGRIILDKIKNPLASPVGLKCPKKAFHPESVLLSGLRTCLCEKSGYGCLCIFVIISYLVEVAKRQVYFTLVITFNQYTASLLMWVKNIPYILIIPWIKDLYVHNTVSTYISTQICTDTCARTPTNRSLVIYGFWKLPWAIGHISIDERYHTVSLAYCLFLLVLKG